MVLTVASSSAGQVISSWSIEPVPAAGLMFFALLYVVGWARVSRIAPARFPVARLVSFLCGLLTVFVAISSPLDAFASWLLSVHMVQHLLLTMVAPPLILLGCPMLPLLSGLPRGIAARGLGPFLSDPFVKRLGGILVHPVVAGGLFMLSNVVWHIPAFYELALGSDVWHQFEHACFLGTALLFWWPVVQPWPARPVWPRWSMIPYLLVVDVQNTILSGFFTFYDRVLYPTYAAAPRLTGLSAIHDQAAAGAIMWVPGSIAYLVPAAVIAVKVLGAGRLARPTRAKEVLTHRKTRTPKRGSGVFDLLRVPVLGRVLRGRWFRRGLQVVMVLLAALVVADGFLGPQVDGMNLAGVLPWTHWRGFTVLALLVAGNFFCMACPFTFARDLGRRIFPASHHWPKALRSKWGAVGLLVVFFWAYEFWDLWATPWWTASIIVFYFAAAVLVDGFFRGASFCKYVCPIGQFHFVSSLASPLEVRVREAEICAGCRTHDCLRGNESQRGCELHLFQPAKSGNMDCTFCLDCVQACPADNVGILAVPPGSDLLHVGKRSAVGDYARRPDLAALVLLLTFAAFANAAGMVTPVLEWIGVMGGWSESLVFLGVVVALPGVAALVCGWLSRLASEGSDSLLIVISRQAMMFAPIGFSMWVAHFVYHLATGFASAWPVIQRVAGDVGLSGVQPDWAVGMPMPDWLPGIQLLFLNAGGLFTLWLLWRVALRESGARALGMFLPWAGLVLLLYAAGVWIFLQPMEMRGTLMH